MDIKLPTLTIQPGWTAESQLVKCQEELDVSLIVTGFT